MADERFQELITSMRARLEAELDAQLPALAARHEDALNAARTAAEADAEQKWSAILQEQKGEADRQVASALAAARSQGPDARALLDAFRTIDSAASASAMLTAITTAVSRYSPKAVLYVGATLEGWNGAGRGSVPALHEALETGRTIHKAAGGIVVPLQLDGVAVAVLEADPPDLSSQAHQGWADTVELIVRYGAAQLARLTAVRTAEAQRWIQPVATGAAPRPSEQETSETVYGSEAAQSARRYARLLISEIKLYNESAVHEGRAHRDLARRLAPEIERARRLYEERVPPTVADRGRHFHQELIQILAGGDSALLG